MKRLVVSVVLAVILLGVPLISISDTTISIADTSVPDTNLSSPATLLDASSPPAHAREASRLLIAQSYPFPDTETYLAVHSLGGTDNYKASAIRSAPDFSADGEPVVRIDAPDEVAPGSDFTVTVNVTEVTNLDTFQFKLSYNASVIKVLGVEDVGRAENGTLTTLVDTDKSWIDDQWIGMYCNVLTTREGLSQICQITGNNATTLTVNPAWHGIPDHSWVYQIKTTETDQALSPGLIDSTSIPIDLWGFFPWDTPGTIMVLGNVPGVTGVTGSGYLVKIHFHVVGSPGDSSNIAFSEGMLFDNSWWPEGEIVVAAWLGDTVDVFEALFVKGCDADPNPTKVGHNTTFSANVIGVVAPYTCDWDFGDESTHSNLESPTHAYDAVDIHTVTVTVTDEFGNEGTCSFDIMVNEPLALSDCAAVPNPTEVCQNTIFSANATGGAGTHSWYWDFGDGENSTAASPTHAYNTGGNHTACVTVTDSLGNTEECCVDVFVCILGDANLDGIVDMADVTKVESIILKLDAETPCADANQDGEINMADVGTIEWLILGVVPSEMETYTGTVEGREFTIGYPQGWASDAPRLAPCEDFYKVVQISGYTLNGACLMFYMPPDKDTYLQVTSVDSPLPLTIDRVFASMTDEMHAERFPGFVKVSEEEVDRMTGLLVFTFNDGKAKQLKVVTLAPPQVWDVTLVARAGEFAAWESQFDEIIASFEMK